MFHDFYKDIVHVLTTKYTQKGFHTTQNKKSVVRVVNFQFIAEQLYKMGLGEILHHCVLEHERLMVLNEAHVGFVGFHYPRK